MKINPFSLENANLINTSEMKLQKFDFKMPELNPNGIDPASIPEDKVFAQVKVGNKVVATVTNNGFVGSSNAYGSKIRNLVESDSGKGPNLAAERAEKIAKAFGGTVVKSPDAMTQLEWGQHNSQSMAAKPQPSTGNYYNSLLSANTLNAILSSDK